MRALPLLILKLLYFISSSKNCITSPKNSEECLECKPGFYRASLELDYQTFGVDDCIQKSDEVKRKRALVSLAPCPSCSGLFDDIYTDLETALKESRLWSLPFASSVLELYLSNQIHDIGRVSLKSLRLFRNDAVNLKISALFCQEFTTISESICFSSLEEMALIRLRKQQTHFFVLRELKLISLIFDAIDSHINYEQANCVEKSEGTCCDEASLGSISDAVCSVRGWSLGRKGEAVSSNGALIQVQRQDIYNNTPLLFISKCAFSNFQTKWLDVGFDSLIKIAQQGAAIVYADRVTIRNCYFWGGVIFLGGETASGEANLAPIFIKITYITITGYNMFGISDQDFNLLPSLFDLNDQDTHFFMEKANLTNVSLVLHKMGAENLISVKNNPLQTYINIFNLTAEGLASKGALLYTENSQISIKGLRLKDSLFLNDVVVLKFKVVLLAFKLEFKSFFLQESKHFFFLAEKNRLVVLNLVTKNSTCHLLTAKSSYILLASIVLNLITFSSNFVSLESCFFQILDADFKYLISPKSILDTKYVNEVSAHRVNLSDMTLSTVIRSPYLSVLNISRLLYANNSDVPSFLGLGDVFRIIFIADSTFLNSRFYVMFGIFLGNPPTLKFMYMINVKMFNISFVGSYMLGLYLVVLKISESSLEKIQKSSVGVIVNIFSVVLYSVLLMTKTTIKDCGFTKEPEYLGFIADYTIFMVYQATSAQVDSCTFIQGNTTSLVSGFISATFIDQTVSISNCVFTAPNKNGQYSYMGVIIQGASTVYFINNTMSDLECPTNKLMFISTYHRNGVISLRAFGLEQSQNNSKKAIVAGNVFRNCRCQQAGSLFVENYRSLFIQGNYFLNSTAHEEKGGHVMILGADSVEFLLNSLTQSKATGQGGALYIDSVMKINVNSSNFSKCSSAKEGGCIYLKDVSAAAMMNIRVDICEAAVTGGFLFLESSALDLTMLLINSSKAGISGGSIGASFNSKISLNKAWIYQSLSAEYGGFLLAESAALVSLIELQVFESRCEAGGILYLAEITSLRLESVLIKNSRTRSGVIFWNAQTTEEHLASYYIRSIICESNIASIGTCLYLRVGYKVVELDLISVTNCSNGVAVYSYPQRNINIIIRNLTISSSASESALLYFRGLNITIEEAFFKNNKLGFALFALQAVLEMKLSYSVLSLNRKLNVDKEVSALACEASNVHIINLTQSRDADSFLNEISLVLAVGGTIKLEGVSQFTFVSPPAPLISTEYGNLFIKESNFSFIESLVLKAINSNVMIEKSIFYKIGLGKLNAVYSQDSLASVIQVQGSFEEEFHLEFCQFKEFSGLGVVSFNSRLVHFSFIKFWASEIKNASALRLINAQELSIEDSSFSDFRHSYLGGAILIDNYDNVFYSISITRNLFVRNAAEQGGAIYITNVQEGRAVVSGNVFQQQVAWIGGAVFFYANNIATSIKLEGNTFDSNYALLHSPTVYSITPSYEVSNKFQNNSDEVKMTETVVSLPIKISFFDKTLNKTKMLRVFKNDLEIEAFLNETLGVSEPNQGEGEGENFIAEIKSGHKTAFRFLLTDTWGQSLVFDNGSSVSIEPLYAKFFKENNKIFLENSLNKTLMGRVDFNELYIRGKVNTFYVLQMKINIANEKFYATRRSIEIKGLRIRDFADSDTEIFFVWMPWLHRYIGIDILRLMFADVELNSFVLQKIALVSKTRLNQVLLKIKIQFCNMGQLLTSDYTCTECTNDYYSNLDPALDLKPGENSCKPCPQDAVCPGGALIYPKAGFWRFGKESTQIIACFKEEACVGPIEGSLLADLEKGVCAKGHRGHLCHFCDPDYGKITSESLCYFCDEISPMVSAFFILASGGIVIYSVVNAFLFSSMSSKNKILARETTMIGVLLKILMDFGQQISIASNLNLNLPSISLVTYVVKNMKYTAVTIEDLILNECYLRVIASEDEEMIAMRYRLIGIIPVFYCLLNGAFLFLFMLFLRRVLHQKDVTSQTTKEFFFNFLIKFAICSAITIDLFIPMIVDTCFFVFNCLTIVEKDKSVNGSGLASNYLYINPNIPCWETYHYGLIYKIIAPVLITWGCLYPFLIFLILKSNAEKTLPQSENVSSPNRSTIPTSRKQHAVSIFKEMAASDAANEKRSTEFIMTNTPVIPTQQNESVQEINIEGSVNINKADKSDWPNNKENVVTPLHQNFLDNKEPPIENLSFLSDSNSGKFMRSTKLRLSTLENIKVQSKKLWNVIHTTFHQNSILAFYHEGYRKEFIYWECVIILKNVLVRFFFSMRFVWGTTFSSFSLIIIYTYFLGINIRKRPYIFELLNKIKILSIEINMVIFLGMLILASETSSIKWREFASVMCVLCFLGFLTALLFYSTASMRKIVAERKKKLNVKLN